MHIDTHTDARIETRFSRFRTFETCRRPPRKKPALLPGDDSFPQNGISFGGVIAIRRLTTIVAADLAAYSRLMAADEEGVISRLSKIWSEVVNPLVDRTGGRVVKTMGDGFLAEFPSPAEAVRAALSIQDAMAERDLDRPEQERLRFRIGANVGDVVLVDEDILGDAVNVAARLSCR